MKKTILVSFLSGRGWNATKYMALLKNRAQQSGDAFVFFINNVFIYVDENTNIDHTWGEWSGAHSDDIFHAGFPINQRKKLESARQSVDAKASLIAVREEVLQLTAPNEASEVKRLLHWLREYRVGYSTSALHDFVARVLTKLGHRPNQLSGLAQGAYQNQAVYVAYLIGQVHFLAEKRINEGNSVYERLDDFLHKIKRETRTMSAFLDATL